MPILFDQNASDSCTVQDPFLNSLQLSTEIDNNNNQILIEKLIFSTLIFETIVNFLLIPITLYPNVYWILSLHHRLGLFIIMLLIILNTSMLPNSPPTLDHSKEYSNASLNPQLDRPMVTRPNLEYTLVIDYSVNTDPKILMMHFIILFGWRQCMKGYVPYIKITSGFLFLRTPDMNIVGSKWIYKTKFKSDGSVE